MPSNFISFGSPAGTFTAIDPASTGGQEILFKWEGGETSSGITAVQIGNTIYGGQKGTESFRALLPEDGTFYLKQIQASPVSGFTPLFYFDAVISGQECTTGEQAGGINLSSTIEGGFAVRLSGINSDKSYVYSLQFEIVDTIGFNFGSTFATVTSNGNNMLQPSDTLIIDLDTSKSGNTFITALTINNTTYGIISKGETSTSIPITSSSKNFNLQLLQALGPSFDLFPALTYMEGEIDGTSIDIGKIESSSTTSLTIDSLPLTLIGVATFNGMLCGLEFSNLV
jgi:hypothetical protein